MADNGLETGRPPLTIDFVSDPICPWCYIGFRALDWAAMALSFEFDLEVRYRPYRLDPDTPAEGRDRHARIVEKYPDANHRQQMQEALGAAMRDVGLSFDPALPARIPDATDAHRLVRWAHEEGLAREVLGAVFEAYWLHGEDISHPDVLMEAGAAAGLPAAAIGQRLASREDRSDVVEEAAAFRQGGVRGIPAFIVNEETGFEGALPKDELLAALRTLGREASVKDAAR
jgi:predicted DsbA family dithiol-disulfide isomerase